MAAPAPLRDVLKIRRLVQRNEITYVIKEPDKQAYYRFSEAQYLMLTLFDGQKDLDALLEAFDEASEEYAYDKEALLDLIRSAKDFQLLQRTQEEEKAAFLEKLRAQRKGRFLQAKGSLLNMRFHLHDPSLTLDRVLPYLRWLWTPQGVYASIVLIAVAVAVVLLQWDRFTADFERVFFFSQQSGENALTVWLIILSAIAVHEMGHGLTCRHFGGDVDDMGVLLLAFQPCLYANVNDAWLFENNRHKLYVALAGVWVELILCAFAVFIWTMTDVDSFIGRISFILVTVATASSLFLNLNPLMKFDGYYILSDHLEIPNLRQNAIDWFSFSLKKHLLHLDVPPPFDVDHREKKIYFYYGLLIVVYLTIMLGGLALLGYGAVADIYGFWGILIFLLLVFKLAKLMTGSWVATLKEWIMTKMFSTPQRRVYSSVFGLLLVWALFAWQPRILVLTTGMVDADIVAVHAPESGFIEQIAYQENRLLIGKAGESLFTVVSPELELEMGRTQAQLEGMEIKRNSALVQSDRAKLLQVALQINKMQEQLSGLQGRRGQMSVLIPPGEWQVEAPPPQVMRGRYVARGETVISLVPLRQRRINVLLAQSDLSVVREGDPARIRLSGSPERIFSGLVQSITPVTKKDGPNRLFQVRIDMIIPEGVTPPLLDTTGSVKIEGESAPLWAHLLRPLRTTFRTDLWI
ncbi:efflux RND transporter periplasmic adaptor subunit [Candidatus Magnetaquicoccus inordinatus]|uniref:efflux RND transporter periplasmic adaptor subunit n=1 Tax=Candidatus Magnetaquicoccus inordinatus TaxID=2496818 RepID=UPI00102CED5B|nr:efflux RND transporter periplasmic adaptor subunit [Candidatus Magnetaquicoccus inordinatus]